MGTKGFLYQFPHAKRPIIRLPLWAGESQIGQARGGIHDAWMPWG